MAESIDPDHPESGLRRLRRRLIALLPALAVWPTRTHARASTPIASVTPRTARLKRRADWWLDVDDR